MHGYKPIAPGIPKDVWRGVNFVWCKWDGAGYATAWGDNTGDYCVANLECDNKWWIVQFRGMQGKKFEGPFETPELAWSTLRLMGL